MQGLPFVVFCIFVYFGFHLVYPRGMSALSSMGWGTPEDEAFQGSKTALLLVPNRGGHTPLFCTVVAGGFEGSGMAY